MGADVLFLVGDVVCFGCTDIMIRAIGNRAKPFHSIAYFSFWCVVVSTYGQDDTYLISVVDRGNFHRGMIALKEPLVLPYGWIGWLCILIIG